MGKNVSHTVVDPVGSPAVVPVAAPETSRGSRRITAAAVFGAALVGIAGFVGAFLLARPHANSPVPSRPIELSTPVTGPVSIVVARVTGAVPSLVKPVPKRQVAPRVTYVVPARSVTPVATPPATHVTQAPAPAATTVSKPAPAQPAPRQTTTYYTTTFG